MIERRSLCLSQTNVRASTVQDEDVGYVGGAARGSGATCEVASSCRSCCFHMRRGSVVSIHSLVDDAFHCCTTPVTRDSSIDERDAVSSNDWCSTNNA